MSSIYYNRPAPITETLNKEVPEMDWMTILVPPSYAVAAGYVFVGTILSQNQSSLILRSLGQAGQILGAFTLIRKLSAFYYAPSGSGKGI